MKHSKGPWHLSQVADEFTDYEMTIPDNENGVGGIVRITLVDLPFGESRAYGSFCPDDDQGICGDEASEFEISRETAERMLGTTLMQQHNAALALALRRG